VDAQAILRAIRQTLESAIDAPRALADSTFDRASYAGLDDATIAVRALVRPRFDVELLGFTRTSAVAPEQSSRAVIDVAMRVLLTYSTEHEAREDDRFIVRGKALQDSELARRALCYPGSLAVDAAGAETGIISGCLLAKTQARVVREDWKKRIYQVAIECSALVCETIPTAVLPILLESPIDNSLDQYLGPALTESPLDNELDQYLGAAA
jgi:hypothetical protein